MGADAAVLGQGHAGAPFRNRGRIPFRSDHRDPGGERDRDLIKGDVVYIHYSHRMRHGHPEPISEVIWCYGRYNMAIAPGKQEHEIGNVFATLMPGSEAFYAKSERLFTHGPLPLRVTGEIG